MSREGEPQSSAAEEGPGQQFGVFAQNELVAERLKLLDYEREFAQLGDSLKPIARHYFVHSTNIGEQFHLFTSLCAWLIRKAGIDSVMEMPHEFDDPNATLARILDALKAKDVEVPFAASKLKSGSGPQCVFVLLHLTALALEQSGFRFGVIQAAEEEVGEDNDAQGQADEAELTADQFEEEVEMAEDEDEPTEDVLGTVLGAEHDDGDGLLDTHIGGQLKGVMQSNAADQGQMQEELKRVIPQLKITVRANLKDWRAYAEQMQKLEQTLSEQYAEVKPFLARTGEEIGQALERIRLREQHLNEQFGSLLQLYKNRQNELAALTEQYRESSGTLNSRTETLNALNEEIEQLKQQIEEQGMQNTSGAPILKIKQALAKLERDIFVMRVQCASVEQTLWQNQLRDRLNNTATDFINY